MSSFRFLRTMLLAGGVCSLLLAGAGPLRAQSYDAPPGSTQSAYSDSDQDPGRVARLAYLSGQVQFAPAGENDWGSVQINRPMVLGDRLLTGDDGLAVLELGDASVRIAHDSAFDFLNLSENNVQMELSQGTLNLDLRQLAYDANFEVDTPTIAFVASTPGIYRIDNDPDGIGSMVTVFEGHGVVYGENGASREVTANTSYRFNDSTLADVDVTGLPEPDAFDRFCQARDANYRRYAQREQQYVPPDMIGADQLYEYGQWNAVPQYGHVWYPNTVPAGWAPYRYGRWVWIDPWGWTWVDRQPWGFAPFHYGRWVYIRNRWGWVPGPLDVRPVYAPAMVAFVGGSGWSVSLHLGGGRPVGWFPLGPRDVYVPWFHASRRYFTRVNVTNVRNVYVNKTVINNFYNDYRSGHRPRWDRHHYAYRRMPGAVTAVPRKVFTDARPVHPAVLRLNRNQLSRSEPVVTPGVVPGRESLGLHHTETRIIDVHGRRPFVKPVVARHQPAPRPLPFRAREPVIAQQHGRPLSPVQAHELRRRHADHEPRAERVKLVRELAARDAATSGGRRHAVPRVHGEPAPQPVTRPARGTPGARASRNTVRPIPALRQPLQPQPRAGELRSARFAHPEKSRARPPEASARKTEARHVAPGRLPVVRPLEPARTLDHAVHVPEPRRQQPPTRAPQLAREQVAQPQRRVDLRAQQRAREQQAQRQRQVELQAQQHRQVQMQAQQRAREQQAEVQARQRVREQQMQRQRQVEMQARQRVRAQQAQRQRQAEMQARQRVRAQQVQRQRQAEMQVRQRARAQQAQRQAEVQARQHAQENRAKHQKPQRYDRPSSPRKHHPGNNGNEPRIR